MEVKGIQAYRFAPPSDVLMSPKDNPTNEGFCVPAGDCLGTGVLKVSVCREGKRLPHILIRCCRAWPTFFLMTRNLAPWHSFLPPVSTPQKMSSQSATPSPAWCLTFPLFEHVRFYSIRSSMINCAPCVWRPLKYFMLVNMWCVIALMRQSSLGVTHVDSISQADTLLSPQYCAVWII